MSNSMQQVHSCDSTALQKKMALFINLLVKGLTEEINGDGGSIWWAPGQPNFKSSNTKIRTLGLMSQNQWEFCINRELKQTRRRRKRERHLKMWPRVSAAIFQLSKLIMPEKCILTILELNWNQHLGQRRQNWTFVIICSRLPHNCKTGHFTS